MQLLVYMYYMYECMHIYISVSIYMPTYLYTIPLINAKSSDVAFLFTNLGK